MAGIVDVARKADVPEAHVKAVCAAIQQLTEAGERVSVKGFGTFQYVTRAARQARNPTTNEVVQVPEKTVLKFKPAKK